MLAPFLFADRVEAGCDEAGCGSLAGPVFAAAVILPRGFCHPMLNDSKQVVEKERVLLRAYIEEHAAAWAVAQASSGEIDRLNIRRASILAMHRAVEGLGRRPDFLLVDGNCFAPYSGIPHRCIVRGDGKYASIAAASILAKTHRDDFMLALDGQFPLYEWCDNKGYPTEKHRAAVARHGVTAWHRKSFNLMGKNLGQLRMFEG